MQFLNFGLKTLALTKSGEPTKLLPSSYKNDMAHRWPMRHDGLSERTGNVRYFCSSICLTIDASESYGADEYLVPLMITVGVPSTLSLAPIFKLESMRLER